MDDDVELKQTGGTNDLRISRPYITFLCLGFVYISLDVLVQVILKTQVIGLYHMSAYSVSNDLVVVFCTR